MNQTEKLLKEHFAAYPRLEVRDVCKFLFHGACGCEHMVSNEGAALAYLEREYASVPGDAAPCIEPLDGEYSRVHLSWLNGGLAPATLARMFCLSAKEEGKGRELLEEKVQVAKRMIAEGSLQLDGAEFDKIIAAWRDAGYPALHHSDAFREAYHPAYRVVSNRFANYLPLFAAIDQMSDKDSVIVAIEGGSASGKSMLASVLHEVYSCTVFHMDDFFLRPEQRTVERLAEVGGNVDRERFAKEILQPLTQGRCVQFRRFDCATQSLGREQTVTPGRLTVIEGAYAMHPAFGRYYDLAVFLDIDPDLQKKRILARNTPAMAKRFFNEWIPLENRYFEKTATRRTCDLVWEEHLGAAGECHTVVKSALN